MSLYALQVTSLGYHRTPTGYFVHDHDCDRHQQSSNGNQWRDGANRVAGKARTDANGGRNN